MAASLRRACNVVSTVTALLLHSTPVGATDRYFIGAAGGYWNTASNWSPVGVPGGSDSAFLIHDVVWMSGPTAGIDYLWLDDGSILNNLGFRILVDDVAEEAKTDIVGGSLLIVSPTGEINDMDTDYLDLAGGTVLLQDGAILDVDTYVHSKLDSSIDGDGTLLLNGGMSSWGSLVASDGDLFTTDGGTLRITGPGYLFLNSPGASLIAREPGSHLVIDVPVENGFAGVIDVGPACSVELPSGFSILGGTDRGLIELEDGNLVAPELTLAGDVLASGLCRVLSSVVVSPGAFIWLGDADTDLTLLDAIRFNGGSFNMGAGTLVNARELGVTIDTSITVGTLDLDGPLAAGAGCSSDCGALVSVHEFTTLAIDAERIDSGPVPGEFKGTLQLLGGTLDIDLGAHDFVLTDGGLSAFSALINCVDSGGSIPAYRGANLVIGGGASVQVFDATGGTAHPQAYLISRVQFVGGAVRFQGNEPWLVVDGFSIFDGGTEFESGGVLRLSDDGGGTNVRADQVIGCVVEITESNPVRLDPNVTLELQGGAALWGAPIENTFGPGTDTALILDGDSRVNNDVTISTDRFDWSGAVRGDRMTVYAGATFTIDSPELNDLFNEYADQLVVEDGATVHVNTEDSWRLRTYSGGGQAVIRLLGPDAIVDGQLLDVRFGNIVGNGKMRCPVINEGDVVPTDDAFDPQGTDALRFGSSFQQRPGGRLHLDIDGPGQDQHDRIVVAGSATLAGLLRIRLRDGYVPPVGYELTAVEASSIVGTFDTIDSNLPAGLTWSLIYDADRVRAQVKASVPGDVTGDGLVDVADLLAVLSAWGDCPEPCPPTCPGDADGDCSVGVGDLLLVLGNWGG